MQEGMPINVSNLVAAEVQEWSWIVSRFRFSTELQSYTDEETSKAIRRKTVIANEHAIALAFVAFTVATLGNRLVHQNQENHALQEQMQQMQEQMQQMQTSLQQGQQGIRQDIRIASQRNEARVKNAWISRGNEPLAILLNDMNEEPLNFPVDQNALQQLTSQKLNELLIGYGKPTHGDIAERRKRLADFIWLP